MTSKDTEQPSSETLILQLMKILAHSYQSGRTSNADTKKGKAICDALNKRGVVDDKFYSNWLYLYTES